MLQVRLSSPYQPRLRFARDSPLEEDGFELVVPLSKRTAVPSSPFGFPALSACATGSYDPQTVTDHAARGSALAQIRAECRTMPGFIPASPPRSTREAPGRTPSPRSTITSPSAR